MLRQRETPPINEQPLSPPYLCQEVWLGDAGAGAGLCFGAAQCCKCSVTSCLGRTNALARSETKHTMQTPPTPHSLSSRNDTILSAVNKYLRSSHITFYRIIIEHRTTLCGNCSRLYYPKAHIYHANRKVILAIQPLLPPPSTSLVCVF